MSATGSFGRSTFLLQTNKTQFKADLQQSEVDARSSASVIDQSLSKVGEGFSAGAKKGADEFAKQMDRAKASAKESTSQITQFFGRLGEGLTLGGGVALADAVIRGVSGAASAAGEAVVGYGTKVQNATILLKGFTGSQGATNDALALARKEADAGRGSFTDLANTVALLGPVAKESGESLQELVRLTEILGASNSGPEGGINGAVIALREAGSGDFTSFARRFNISRSAIQDLKDEGVPNIEIVRRSLDNLGIGFGLVEEKSKSLDSLRTRLSELAQRTIFSASGGESGAFGAIQSGVSGTIDLLNSTQVQEAARKFGATLAQGLGELERIAQNPNLRRVLGDIAALTFDKLERGLQAVSDGLTIVGTVAEPVIGALRAVDEGGRALSSGLESLGTKLTGTQTDLGAAGTSARLLADGLIAIAAPGPAKFFAIADALGLVAKALRDSNDEVDRARKNPELNAVDDKGRPVPLPGAAPGSNLPARQPGTTRPIDTTTTSNNDLPTGLPANYYDKLRQASIDAATQAALDYVRTFGTETKAQFDQLGGFLKDTLIAAAGGDETKVSQRELANGYSAIARALIDVQNVGKPTAESVAALRQAFGESADTVLDYVNGLATLKTANENVTRTTQDLANAQANLKEITRQAKEAEETQQRNVTSAENRRKQDQAEANRALEDQRAIVAGIQKDASDTADRYSAIGRGLQDLADGARSAATAAQAARAAVIQQAQEELAADQKLQAEHAAAFAAIQNGTVAQFLALNGEVDASTRKIIDAYGEQAKAAIAARDAATDKADAVGVEGRAKLLDLETKIRAARQSGNYDEAAALERTRDIESKRYSSREAFARQQAAVAQDQVNAALKPVQAAAQAQAAQDAAETRASQAKIARLTAEDKTAREGETARIAAIEQQIKDNDRAAQKEADRYKASLNAANDQLAAIQRNANEQDRRDLIAIGFQTALLGAVKAVNNERITQGQKAVDQAQALANAAKDERDAQKESLTVLQDKIKAIQEFAKQFPGVDFNLNPLPGTQPNPAQQSGGGALPPSYNPPPPPPPGTEYDPVPDTALGRRTNSLRTDIPAMGYQSARAASLAPFVVQVPNRPVVTLNGRISDAAGNIATTNNGQTFNGPLVSLAVGSVDSPERAQEIARVALGAVSQALDKIGNAGPPTFSRQG